MVLPWVPPLVSSLLTCSWKSLKSRKSVLPHPCLQLRYEDDSFIIQQAEHSHQFLQPSTPWTNTSNLPLSNLRRMASYPFLDTLISPGPSNTLTISVYRNQPQMDQYLHSDSKYNLLAKYSVYNTLAQRPRVVCKSPSVLKHEEDHIRKALLRCSSPHGP